MIPEAEAHATQKIEAVLLISPRPISAASLKSVTDISGEDLRTALAILSERYSPEMSGIVLRSVAGGYQLATNPACAAAVERFRKEGRPAPLSNAAHEALACALYLGPLTRAEISAARGVNSDAVVRNLIERGLLSETGTATERPGTPALLDVNEEFLAASGAASREDYLPLDSLVNTEELSRVRERVGAAEEKDGSGRSGSPEEGT